jgi:hypothetical protein
MNQNKTRPKSENTEGSRLGVFLIILSLLLASAALLWPTKPSGRWMDGLSAQGLPNSIEQNSMRALGGAVPTPVLHQINEHIKDTQVRSDLNQQATALENSGAPTLPSGQAPSDSSESNAKVNPLVLEQVNPNEPVLKDLRGGASNSAAPTPDQRISSKLAKEKWVQEYEQRYQEEYIRQFKENAHNDGVDLKLNKNLDVTGATFAPVDQPLRVPQSVGSGSPNK